MLVKFYVAFTLKLQVFFTYIISFKARSNSRDGFYYPFYRDGLLPHREVEGLADLNLSLKISKLKGS